MDKDEGCCNRGAAWGGTGEGRGVGGTMAAGVRRKRLPGAKGHRVVSDGVSMEA